MASVNDAQANYIRGQLVQRSLIYTSASTFGQKFGIYYYRQDGQQWADFAPIGKYKDWETNWSSFVALVGEVMQRIDGKVVE